MLHLPFITILHILSFCSLKDIFNIQKTCKTLRALTDSVQNFPFWQTISLQSFEEPILQNDIWMIPGIYLFYWEDATTWTSGNSSTFGLIQLIDVNGYLFERYHSEFCAVFDLFGGIYDLQGLI